MPKEKTIFKGRIFDLVSRTIDLPNGLSKPYDLVRHRGAAVIIPLLSKDKVVLIKQFRPVLGRYIIELPAGSIDKGEKPSACAKRELIEETGFGAGKIEFLGNIIPCAGYSTEILHIYKATGLDPVEASHAAPVHGMSRSAYMKENDEIIEPMIRTKAHIRKMFKDGKIVDAKTIAAFAMIGWV